MAPCRSKKVCAWPVQRCSRLRHPASNQAGWGANIGQKARLPPVAAAKSTHWILSRQVGNSGAALCLAVVRRQIRRGTTQKGVQQPRVAGMRPEAVHLRVHLQRKQPCGIFLDGALELDERVLMVAERP